MTSDGTNSYSWDAENRLIQVTYPGSGNNSQLFYDGLGQAVKLEERTSGSVTSTKQFIWCENEKCEERDGSGALTRQFYGWGEKASGTNYFYSKDHLGSVREMTDGSGNIQAQYGYDPYGLVTLLQGSNLADFQYAGYYLHQRSGLNLTLYRAYSSGLGRWLSRDPISDDINLYAYVNNDPIRLNDPLGLQADSVSASLNKAIAGGNPAEIKLVLEAGGLSAAQIARAQQVVYRLENTAQEYIGKYCQGSLNNAFPRQYLSKTGQEILKEAKSGIPDAQSAQKLLTDSRFLKVK
jgi:RHS repeat-associated protein